MKNPNRIEAMTLRDFSAPTGWLRQSVAPLLIAAALVIGLAAMVVFTSRSAWQLLGIGRGFVPPELYHYSALMVILGTTFGQFVGWVAGSALLAYVRWWVTEKPATLKLLQISATIVYFGLAALPLFFFHFLFGGPLAGIPQEGLPEWLQQNYPGAYWLLITAHPMVDWSLVPLGIAVVLIFWGRAEQVLRNRALQALVLFLILGTSLVVALSLAIHSTLAHIRIAA